jgi:UDP-3-O-[3-hydroxymyristoyl] glucosamine N-acyltransferase
VLAPDGPDTAQPSLRAAHPYLAFVRAMELLHPPAKPAPGIHPTAVIAASATIGPGASIGPYVVIGERVRLGRDAILHPHVVIYTGARIGDGFVAHAGAVVREDVVIGDRVVVHAGAAIGSEGFGYLPLPDGNRRIPQIGTVQLEDEVEVGANTTIDRGALGPTVVGRGTKLDNLVMIGHGSRLGDGCLLAGQVGLAGSTTLGARVMMGGQAGAAGHLTIGRGAQIAAQTGVHGDIPDGGVYGGYPAMESRIWRRVTVAFARLPELFRRVRRLERSAGIAADEDE